MKKSLRIGYNRYYDEDIFKKHLNYVKENLDVIDEITLFVEFSHYGYWPIDFCKKSAEILSDRIARYKKIGVKSVGINVMCTIGHVDEGWAVLPRAELQYIVNETGEKSKSCLCPSNKDFLDYVSNKYALYAATGADFIWYDDDVRASMHGIARGGCFCPKCIDKFNEKNSTMFTRDSLVSVLKDNDKIRHSWDEFLSDIKRTLVKTICDSVKNASPEIKVGAMTIPDEGIPNESVDMGRPGGGFYNDDIPTAVLDKYFNVYMQLLSYPSNVNDIQYEYEAFNYQNLHKSMQITEVETALAIMAGCSGVLYNNDIFNDRTDITKLFRERKRMWDTLSEIRKKTLPCGVYCVEQDILKRINEIGIPVTLSEANASVALVTGEQLDKMNDDEIKMLLKKSLFTDGKGVSVLCEKGYKEYCGGNVKNIYNCGMAERFSENELNGNFKNYYRDTFMNFIWDGDVYEFEVSKNAEILANLETITHTKKDCTMYIYNNTFAADGYLKPKSLLSSAKQEQLYNVLDALSKFSLPVKIKKSLRVAPIVSKGADGEMIIMLFNLSLDETGAFELEIRNDGVFYQLDKNGDLLPLQQKAIGDNTSVGINNIERFDYIILTNTK